MKKVCLGTLAAGLMVSTASAASAQSSLDWNEFAGTEARVMVGITVPLGGDNRRAENQPRFDLTIEGTDIGPSTTDPRSLVGSLQQRRNARRLSLAWTFEDQPRFLLNGTALNPASRFSADEETDEEEKEGRTTGQKVLRGAAVAGGVAALVVGVAVAAIVIDCNSDDGCGE